MFVDFQINLYVRDVERALAFWTAIGGSETFRTPAEGTPVHAEVRLGGATVGVASVAAARDDHGLDVSAEGNAAEVVLWTDDLAGDWDLLLEAGAEPMAEPLDLPTGLSVAWAADPDGNPVHLVMRRPA
jgi:uncharacterized glyoxalase superfamily protein PhnB